VHVSRGAEAPTRGNLPPEVVARIRRAQERLKPLTPAEEARALALSETEVAPGVQRRTQTISGLESEAARSVVRPNLNDILAQVDAMELTGAISSGQAARMRMSGGRQLAVHAEIQQSVLRPNQPIVVNRPMCFSCFEYFQGLARFNGIPQMIADPDYIRIFHPDGTIQEFSTSGELRSEFGIQR
jgi:hypothetical protein